MTRNPTAFGGVGTRALRHDLTHALREGLRTATRAPIFNRQLPAYARGLAASYGHLAATQSVERYISYVVRVLVTHAPNMEKVLCLQRSTGVRIPVPLMVEACERSVRLIERRYAYEFDLLLLETKRKLREVLDRIEHV